jgi:hypothetical protein
VGLEEAVLWKPLNELRIDREARSVVRQFVINVGFRTNAGASWELLDPAYPGRESFTRARWAKDDIPVAPVSFPLKDLRAMRFDLAAKLDKEILLEVALAPKSGRPDRFRKGVPDRFGMGLTRRRQGWLVQFWLCRSPCRDRRSPK